MRQFLDIDLTRDLVPDETTVCKFRHLLERNKLGAKLFEEVGRQLQAKGMKRQFALMVDATIINAPSSTKNKDKARDPEMHQTRKGNPVVLRDEDAHRRRQPDQADPFRDGDGG